MENFAEIYLAGGCFWGMQKYLDQVEGVLETEAGYANGSGARPSYEEVCAGEAAFAETVRVRYDPVRAPLRFLLGLYFDAIDPTAVNRQGEDRGIQYRTGIYYTEERDRALIEEELAALSRRIGERTAVECAPLRCFYPAEEYHQKYLEKNPGGYCHIGAAKFAHARESRPQPRFGRPDDGTLRRMLSAGQYAVTQQGATEPPFDNAYWNHFEEGIYVDVTTGEPLFLSCDKFDSGCGWPAFSRPIAPEKLAERTDRSHGMVRTEVRSSLGGAHLGHVFTDGPEELGGMRYCINSAALRFIPREKMAREGYAQYLPLLERG